MSETITRKMPWYQFASGNYEIDEFDCASAFLFTGSERALLLDTGTGIGDLKGLVEELADVLMYYNDVLLCYGITAEELKHSYTEKFERNMKRW